MQGTAARDELTPPKNCVPQIGRLAFAGRCLTTRPGGTTQHPVGAVLEILELKLEVMASSEHLRKPKKAKINSVESMGSVNGIIS